MAYCFECGTKMIKRKPNKFDDEVDFCETCQAFRFPMFNNAISLVILNPALTHVLLIQQYGRPSYILVAGYINKGENAIEALKREMYEEVGLTCQTYLFNDSSYYERTNTLMTNFIVIASQDSIKSDPDEVDLASWIPLEECEETIRPHSLAKYFLKQALPKIEAYKKTG